MRRVTMRHEKVSAWTGSRLLLRNALCGAGAGGSGGTSPSPPSPPPLSHPVMVQREIKKSRELAGRSELLSIKRRFLLGFMAPDDGISYHPAKSVRQVLR